MAAPYLPLICALCIGVFSAGALAEEPQNAPTPRQPAGETSAQLSILTPEVLELTLRTRGSDWTTAAAPFPFIPGKSGVPELPSPAAWKLTTEPPGKEPYRVTAQGIWRMPVLVDYHKFSLVVETRIALRISPPLQEGSTVKLDVTPLLKEHEPLSAQLDPRRQSPAIHVADIGFAPEFPKFAFVSRSLGTLGELSLPEKMDAAVLDADDKPVLRIPLVHRSSPDWEFDQSVWRADFSELRQPGTYRLQVPGLGVSRPFRIAEDTLLVAPRLLAGVLYAQRSGVDKGPPFTRFGHPASHTAPAEIPDTSERFAATNRHLAKMARKNTDPSVQTAPVLSSVSDSLYPFVRTGKVDVSGGHFDAGDYSKYTINSAQLIHYLTFAVDHFRGVADVDNLGIPESGDGIPDALQIALHEARFLIKMQDSDGGFYFLVYPRDRPYELDVLPQDGDPQVVFPKTTAATAAATGALAQLARSPSLQKFDAAFAQRCAAAAKNGWAFLARASEKFGFEGSYQAVSHYGAFAGHKDEWAFAAAALFALTGEKQFEHELMALWPEPDSRETKRWGWLALPDSFGAAARVYAFCEGPGFLPCGSRNDAYFKKIRAALLGAADTWLELSDADAYGIPFSRSAKRQKRAGWFWAFEPALDLACAWLLEPSPDFRARADKALALWAAYEAGGNPLNLPFYTGIGSSWRRYAVNRISLNDDRLLALPGIPIGNVISTVQNLEPYKVEGRAGLRALFVPAPDDFPFYERSGTDAYNVRQEWTIATGARLLAGHLFRLGRIEPLPDRRSKVPVLTIRVEPSNPKPGEIARAWLTNLPERACGAPTIMWELIGTEPATGTEFSFRPLPGPNRLEVEVLWPDGLRSSAVLPLAVR